MNSNIKLKFQICKTANLFHFISNLTDWHFSARPMYKEVWLKETGLLSVKEKQVLRRIEKVFQKYTFGPNYWGRVFLLEPDKKVWQVAKRDISPSDLKVFKEAANIFNPRFQKIWKGEEYLLQYWKYCLEVNKDKYFSAPLIEDLNNFFGVLANVCSIHIILLIATDNSFGGGANFNKGVITLEIGLSNHEVLTRAMSTLWHEITHSFWKTKKQDDLIDKSIEEFNKDHQLSLTLFERARPLHNIIEEAIVESLFPRGYLAEKYFNLSLKEYYGKELKRHANQKEKNMEYWRVYSSFHLKSLSKKYIESKKALDEAYIKEVLKLLDRFLKTDKITVN